MIIDTRAHLDVEGSTDDLPGAIGRAYEVGVGKIFLPAIDFKSVDTVLAVCRQSPGTYYPMIGLQLEGAHGDWRKVLDTMYEQILLSLRQKVEGTTKLGKIVTVIGEVELDFYWTRGCEKQQLAAPEETAKWSVGTRFPLMIHCYKAQSEMLYIIRLHEKRLSGGVFHCFTDNQEEAKASFRFDRFMLDVGGVSTFKGSHLREGFLVVVPLDRIVLETDSPYMVPVPHRGKRNENAFIVEVIRTPAPSYGTDEARFVRQTNKNACRMFGIG